MVRRARSLLGSGAILAAALAASACATPRPAILVEDAVAREELQARIVGTGETSADRLTREEYGRLERALDRVSRGAPPGGPIVLQIVSSESRDEDVSSTGRRIDVTEAHARWLLREVPGIGEEYLSFELAHEVGHLTVECEKTCALSLECENKVDVEARRALEAAKVYFAPSALLPVASKRLGLVRAELQSERACPAHDLACVAARRAGATRSCLSAGEVELRYAELLRDRAATRRADSWSQRRDAVEERRSYEALRTGQLPRYVELCGEIADAVPASADPGECIRSRRVAFQARVKALPPVPVPAVNSRELWSDRIRWQDDADWGIQASAGAAWGDFRHPDLGNRSGWVSRALALWLGGGEDGPGFRVAYGRFGSPSAGGGGGPTGTLDYLGLDLVARSVKVVGPRVAFVSDIGVGGVRIADPSGTRWSVLGNLETTIAFAPVRRVTLGVGGAYAFSGSLGKQLLTSQVLTALVTLDLHLGDHGARMARRGSR